MQPPCQRSSAASPVPPAARGGGIVVPVLVTWRADVPASPCTSAELLTPDETPRLGPGSQQHPNQCPPHRRWDPGSHSRSGRCGCSCSGDRVSPDEESVQLPPTHRGSQTARPRPAPALLLTALTKGLLHHHSAWRGPCASCRKQRPHLTQGRSTRFPPRRPPSGAEVVTYMPSLRGKTALTHRR